MNDVFDISVITVNYNGFTDTCELIDSISAGKEWPVEIIVVDNGSEHNEAALLKERYTDNVGTKHTENIGTKSPENVRTKNGRAPHPYIITIRSEQNLGFAGGNNLGIRRATGKYIFLLNNDTVVRDFSFASLINRIESRHDIGAVCPKIRFEWGNRPIQFAGYTRLSPITVRNRAIGFGEEERGQYNTARPTPYAHGAAMMLKREVTERAGLMPECFFLYYEEIDWSFRIYNAGYTIWYEPRCTVFHKESRSTGQNSPLRTYYITRNRLLLVKRNIRRPARYLSYLYLTMIVATKDIVRHTANGRRDLVKATIKGISDFLKL